MNLIETNFEKTLRICSLEIIVDMLSDFDILYQISKCNKYLNRTMLKESLRLIEFPLSIVCNDSNKIMKSEVQKLYVDNISVKNIISLNIFKKLKKLRMGYYFNQEITTDTFPCNLIDLSLGNHFNFPFRINTLPCQLKQLIFGEKFNKPLIKDSFPNSLTNLTFGYNFDRPIFAGVFPLNLTKLTFGHNFNKNIIEGVFPENLIQLTFGSNFNKAISKESYPCNLEELSFGFQFHQYISNSILPAKLKNIHIWDNKNSQNLSNNKFTNIIKRYYGE